MNKSLLSELHRYPLVAVDVETTGTHWYRDRLFGVAVAVAAEDGSHMRSGYWDIRDHPDVLTILRKELLRVKRVINHWAKFDAHFLLNHDIKLQSIECTGVRSALINEHEREFTLEYLAKKYLQESKVDIYGDLAGVFGGKATRDVQMKNLHRADPKLVGKYAKVDPELAIKLWLWQEQQIEEQDLRQVWDLERRLTPVLVDIERGGVCVDLPRVMKALDEINTRVAQRQKELNQLAGREINANSAPQVRAMFGAEQRDGNWYVGKYLVGQTDGGEASFNADVLRSLSEFDKRAELLLAMRKLTKGRSFLTNHILEHEVKGYVYPNYNQTREESGLGTGTGRFSVNDPAMQQIPARDKEVASIVRACFLPDKGHEWVCFDWKQFEFRWFAHYVKNRNLAKRYEDDPESDFHKMVSDLTGLPRSPRYAGDANAKQINLGLVFGMGEGKMAAEMGLPHTVEKRKFRGEDEEREFLVAGPQAKAVFDQYHSAIPGIKELLAQASSIAKSRGYVQTVMGRHLRFPGGKFTHKAGGLVFQGSSADCIKQKMIELHALSKELDFRFLLSVHDENDISTAPGNAKAKAKIQEVLETFDGEKCPILCRIPIRADMGIGPNWWEASK
jgi:DNA polymerase I-like protein with 3'-5' exonuclease and polymerase domains